MVTVQDIGLQLTKPVKELAEWNFPFSQTLEKYCSLFNKTYNKSFGEAGLVLQSSTAVYVHRVDSLWNKIEYFRDIFSTYEHEEVTKSPAKKKDKRFDVRFQEFKTINFAAEVDKNIDMKRNSATYDTIKSKNRRFTQLEKGIAQHVSVDIYDVNGEVIGKKYDFRCNQNISINGLLVDEFAPQDFSCHTDHEKSREKSSSNLNHSHVSESLESSSNTLITDSTIDDDDDEINDPPENNSELVSSFGSNQNLSLSRNTDNLLMETSMNTSSNDCSNTTLNISNQTCLNTSDTTNSSIVTTIDNLNNKNPDAMYTNNNIKENLVCSLLDSPPESIHSKGRRTSTDDSPLQIDADGDQSNGKWNNTILSTPRNTENKTRVRSTVKSTPKSLKRKLLTPQKKRRSMTKKILARIFDESDSSHADRPNMSKQNLTTCLKYIRGYDPLRYDDVTNVTLDLLGFRLRVNTGSDANANDDSTSNDDGISELYSPEPIEMSCLRKENFCDTWFRSNSSDFLPKNVDRWHELMQPKLHEAEKRSTFCIRDYASRIIETLKTSGQRKINFDTVIQTERACEVARYFLASLDLASRQSVDISTDTDLDHSIEIRLPEEDGQCSSNNQADSYDQQAQQLNRFTVIN